jgi:hypothetical protein
MATGGFKGWRIPTLPLTLTLSPADGGEGTRVLWLGRSLAPPNFPPSESTNLTTVLETSLSMQAWRVRTSLVSGLTTLGLIGCGGPTADYKPAAKIAVAPDEHDHGHAEEGPHHGSVVELGADEFHAEIVVDAKAHALKVYLLGPDAKAAATTAAAELTITPEGGAALTLKPAEGSPEGQHTEFVVVDEKAVHEIADSGFIHGTLAVKIGEKSYTAELDVHFHGDHEHMHEEGEKPATQP